MLGLRRHGAIQIDLWLGDVSVFVCDQSLDSVSGLSSLSGQNMHVVLIPEAGLNGNQQIQAALKAITSPLIRRLTFVLASKAVYFEYQKALFALLPEVVE